MCDRSTFDILKFGPSTLITETKWISIYDTIVMQFNEFEVKKRKKKFIKAIFFELENKWYNYLSLESILVYLDRFLHLKIARWIRIRFLRSVFIFHRKFRWSYTFRQFRIREWSFWNGPEQLFHRSVYLPPPVYPQYDENCVEISSPPPPLIICFGK